jgi:hypothetical protein
MSTIIETPVRYTVIGVPKGKRKPVTATVHESVQVESGPDATSDAVFDLAGISMRIAGRRPWLMVPGHGLAPQTSRDEAVASSRSVVTAFGRDTPHTTIGLTRKLPLSIEAFDINLAVEPGRTVADLFKPIDWSDREARVANAREDARRARFVDGILCTDRYEPVFVPKDDSLEASWFRWFVQDVTDGSRLVRGQEWTPETFGEWKDAHASPAMPPVQEDWFGDIDWEADPSIGLGLSVGRKFDSFMNDGEVEFGRDLGFAARRTLAYLSAVDRGVSVRERTDFGRSELEETLKLLEIGLSNVTKPKYEFRVGECSKVINRAREVMDGLDRAIQTPEPDDVVVLTSPGPPSPRP